MAARQQQQQKIQYEDFVPKSESQDQPQATLLHIHLPGFTREQIRVTYVHATRTLRVAGERPLAPDEKRWNRFNEGFPVPENCQVDKIHGSFKNGVLSITMPKLTLSKVPEASRTEKETRLPEASKASTLPNEEKKAKPEERYTEASRGKERLGRLEERKLEGESKPEEKKLVEESRGQERLGRLEERKLEAESKTEEKKLLEESKGKEKLGRLEEKKLLEKSKPEEKKLIEGSKGKERIGALEERKLAEEAREIVGKQEEKKLVEDNKGKERPAKLEEKKLVPELPYKKPVVSGGDVGKGEGGCLVEKEKKGKGIMEKIRAKEMTSEDKRLMMNIGVAALVIFALGAYVSYTFSSSSSSPSASSSPSSSSKPE